jgi:hypothetical protein
MGAPCAESHDLARMRGEAFQSFLVHMHRPRVRLCTQPPWMLLLAAHPHRMSFVPSLEVSLPAHKAPRAAAGRCCRDVRVAVTGHGVLGAVTGHGVAVTIACIGACYKEQQ